MILLNLTEVVGNTVNIMTEIQVTADGNAGEEKDQALWSDG